MIALQTSKFDILNSGVPFTMDSSKNYVKLPDGSVEEIADLANLETTEVGFIGHKANIHKAELTDRNISVLDEKINALNSTLTTQISNAIDDLIAGAPGALDTLNELAAALGNDTKEFNFEQAIKVLKQLEENNKDKITEGIFAPWCMYKQDFLNVGGHDILFAPQSKEDSDLFNRFVLNGYKIIQSWDALVYHFTSRGSRFNKHVGGDTGKNSDEWLHTTTKNGREFIRKWGCNVRHSSLLEPIIFPKYNIAFILKNCNMQLIELLEPWCDRTYIDGQVDPITNSILNHVSEFKEIPKFIHRYVRKDSLNPQYRNNWKIIENE